MPEAQSVVRDEFNKLNAMETWDWDDVLEVSTAKSKYPKGLFARCFPLVGIENAECGDRSEWTWKGRIVFGGDQVRTGEGDWAIFDDVGSVPTTMTASRILLACKTLCPDIIICQSDCESAYVQASLPKDDVTYVYLPTKRVVAG